MVKFYDLKHEESNGILQLVLKLDESEIVKNKKLERVSITLMNRAFFQKPPNVENEDSLQVNNPL